MDARGARWLSSSAIAERYAVHESALFRYSQRGMLGARWDEANATWLYDIHRVADLFLHREHQVSSDSSEHLGVLGHATLAGGRKRQSFVRTRGIQAPESNGTESDVALETWTHKQA